MKSFDVQLRREGAWKTDSTYDNRELAEQRARQYEMTRTRDPVRVVEEVFVEKTQKYVRRTVYRDANFQQTLHAKIDNSRATAPKTTNARQSAKNKGSERTPNQQRSPPAKSNGTLSVYWIFGILVLIVGLGAGSMIALEHFQKLS